MKEAVVFILDAGSSMNAPYPKSSSTTTRLECAKQAIISMISDLMVQSVTNEVCVIVCQTVKTSHHKLPDKIKDEDDDEDEEENADEDVPFPNLTELTAGVMRPNLDLLRKISTIQTATTDEEEAQAAAVQGNFCNAICLAADALYERTHNKKYQRKIVLFTDAGSSVVMDVEQTLTVVDALRNMECQLEVIGLDFDESVAAVYKEPAMAPSDNASSPSHKRIKREKEEDTPHKSNKLEKEEEDAEDSDNGAPAKRKVKNESEEGDGTASDMKDGDDNGDEEQDDGDEANDEEEDIDGCVTYKTKEDRERLLQSLTEKTGGQVIAASTLQHILDINKGKKTTSSTKRKIQFHIAPGLVFEARYMLLTKKESFPSMKTEAAIFDDETMKPLKNSLGQEMTDTVKTVVQFVDEENPEDIIPAEDRTTAIRYGSDLVPMSAFDYEGLKDVEPGPRMEILGYMARSDVPRIYLMGPSYIVSGDTSQRACAAIAGLAQALKRLDKAAICTLIKTKTSAENIVGALLPAQESEYPEPIRLIFLQLPFAGEVKTLSMPTFDDILDETRDDYAEQAEVVDNLIDSLMLDDDIIESGKIPSPALRSWNQTMIQRAMNPKAPPILVRSADGQDPMATPPEILRKAQPTLERLSTVLPLTMKKTTATANKTKNRQGRTVLTYQDFLKEE